MPPECCIIATGMRARIPENEERKCRAPPVFISWQIPRQSPAIEDMGQKCTVSICFYY
jgi:hypothetical protein